MILSPEIKIRTERVIMQPVRDSDINAILEHFTSEITRYMPFNPQGDREEIVNFVNESKRTLSQNTDLVLVALDSNEDFIGCCGIHNITQESVELGLWLKKGVHGKGLGSEIITGLIEFLENHFTFEYILYPVDESNVASRKIPEKLGFIPAKRYKKYKDILTDLSIVEYRKYYEPAMMSNKKP
ncbi:GNAT family N-acetyltransferase [Chryseobacterium indologenes]|uniref:N-acetyltransferase n=1 Tax=Chryseobacterium indologenes TaxID=253 RepID=A0AAD0YYD6_CHRID|nr:GNAT family N-acetyltransferase [Chryseobacterium indologenes]AZB19577.1 N-acetyltransferase [Chryseobacterium indologenes]MBF6646066.1 GNAT family N-acetyltransferase [Chryseobacterium indologenes]MBU3049951.1 GNAT family N-acetyltransferase [Chryseobacterium indologenes]MEB4761113.1 GNAT family N-acetyltransferase [Chryseobacterium indologenes]QQQ70258.1 GNAT family N-acetyltransferase [Chryseobacterium indologenes]